MKTPRQPVRENVNKLLCCWKCAAQTHLSHLFYLWDNNPEMKRWEMTLIPLDLLKEILRIRAEPQTRRAIGTEG